MVLHCKYDHYFYRVDWSSLLHRNRIRIDVSLGHPMHSILEMGRTCLFTDFSALFVEGEWRSFQILYDCSAILCCATEKCAQRSAKCCNSWRCIFFYGFDFWSLSESSSFILSFGNIFSVRTICWTDFLITLSLPAWIGGFSNVIIITLTLEFVSDYLFFAGISFPGWHFRIAA